MKISIIGENHFAEPLARHALEQDAASKKIFFGREGLSAPLLCDGTWGLEDFIIRFYSDIIEIYFDLFDELGAMKEENTTLILKYMDKQFELIAQGRASKKDFVDDYYNNFYNSTFGNILSELENLKGSLASLNLTGDKTNSPTLKEQTLLNIIEETQEILRNCKYITFSDDFLSEQINKIELYNHLSDDGKKKLRNDLALNPRDIALAESIRQNIYRAFNANWSDAVFIVGRFHVEGIRTILKNELTGVKIFYYESHEAFNLKKIEELENQKTVLTDFFNKRVTKTPPITMTVSKQDAEQLAQEIPECKLQ